jgi:HNH endonuclease
MGGISKDTRFAVLQRDGHCCRRCCGTDRLTLHHVRPRRAGGGNSRTNLVTLCEVCHCLWHRWERHRVCFDFFDWLAGGRRRGRASHRSRLVKEMTVLRFTGHTYREVCESLNERELLSPTGAFWKPVNARQWLARTAPYSCSRRSWRLIQWPYFAEPVAGKTWRWRKLVEPIGFGFRGRRRLFSLRYDFVPCISRKNSTLKGWMLPCKRIVVHRTSRRLSGTEPFHLDIPPGFKSSRILLRNADTVPRICRRGKKGYAFIGSRFKVPECWGKVDTWVWEDWQSVDSLFLRYCRERPGWLGNLSH